MLCMPYIFCKKHIGGFAMNKKRIGVVAAAAAVLLSGMNIMPATVSAADAQYPVQEFRFGIGNTNRSLTASSAEQGAFLSSVKEGNGGTRDEKWSLNYISAGTYEIVNSATGLILTNEGGLPVLRQDTDAANQRWSITGTDTDHEGYYLYYKITASDGTALTFQPDSNSVSAEGYTGDNLQKFKLNLDGLEGFAANSVVSQGEKAGTIGGLLGKTLFVSTENDMINALNSNDPLTIVMTQTIDFHTHGQIRVRSNKTITGYYGVTLKDCQLRTNNQAGNDSSDKPSDNIVIRNLTMLAKDSTNCILVNVYSSRNVWLDHITFNSQLNRNRDEVGKFVWVNTPYDGVDLSRSPDYITVSYCSFNNRYWTFAYGTQNNETKRCRTTLMYNSWNNCVRRCPQIGNGIGHIYSSYFNGQDTNSESGTAQIIGGDGSEIVSENCRFENFSQVNTRCISAGGGSEPYRDSGSYLNMSPITFKPKVTSSWQPAKDNYGYTLLRGYDNSYSDTGTFCKTYAGAFKSYDGIKYITDKDVEKFVDTRYPSPFLKDIAVGNEPVSGGASVDTSVPYIFRNVNSGLLLEAAADGNVQQGNTETVWHITEAENGWYKLSADGAYLDVASASAENGANLSVQAMSDSDGQLFRFVANADGSYTIVTKASNGGSAVGIYAGSKDAGANAMQWVRDSSDNQKWTLEVRLEPITGRLCEVNVLDAVYYASWSIADMQVGGQVFGDREIERSAFSEIPVSLADAEYIRTPCDAKNAGINQAEITALQAIRLYAGIDTRVTNTPAWLSGWTKTNDTVTTTNGVTFALYTKQMKSGETVTLGANGQSSGCVNYIAAAVAADTVGDITADGQTNLADVIMLQKYLLASGSITNAKAADLNGDGKINAIDLTLLKRMLLA